MNRSGEILDESDRPTLVGVRISAKGAVARHQSAKELAGSWGGAPNAQPVGGVVRDFRKVPRDRLARVHEKTVRNVNGMAGSSIASGTCTLPGPREPITPDRRKRVAYSN